LASEKEHSNQILKRNTQDPTPNICSIERNGTHWEGKGDTENMEFQWGRGGRGGCRSQRVKGIIPYTRPLARSDSRTRKKRGQWQLDKKGCMAKKDRKTLRAFKSSGEPLRKVSQITSRRQTGKDGGAQQRKNEI